MEVTRPNHDDIMILQEKVSGYHLVLSPVKNTNTLLSVTYSSWPNYFTLRCVERHLIYLHFLRSLRCLPSAIKTQFGAFPDESVQFGFKGNAWVADGLRASPLVVRPMYIISEERQLHIIKLFTPNSRYTLPKYALNNSSLENVPKNKKGWHDLRWY